MGRDRAMPGTTRRPRLGLRSSQTLDLAGPKGLPFGSAANLLALANTSPNPASSKAPQTGTTPDPWM